jgi:hypothetical protein
MEPSRDEELKARTRTAAIVTLAAALVWMGGSWLGGLIGLEGRYAFLLDLAALAAFAWSIVALIGVRRARREMEN